jgi:hypothetical protein
LGSLSFFDFPALVSAGLSTTGSAKAGSGFGSTGAMGSSPVAIGVQKELRNGNLGLGYVRGRAERIEEVLDL